MNAARPGDGVTRRDLPSVLSDAERTVLTDAVRLHPVPPDAQLVELAARPSLAYDPAGAGMFSSADLRHAASATSRPLADVLHLRRSERLNVGAPHRRDLAALLHRSARMIDHGIGDDGGPWSHRPAPSAGGTHPFDLLVLAHNVDGLPAGAYRFSPVSAQLQTASIPAEYVATLTDAVTAAARRGSPPPATVILVANLYRTFCRYPHGLTLLLRDAGALLTVLHLVAADLGLASTILGTGGNWLRPRAAAGEREPLAVDCGALAFGRPLANDATE